MQLTKKAVTHPASPRAPRPSNFTPSPESDATALPADAMLAVAAGIPALIGGGAIAAIPGTPVTDAMLRVARVCRVQVVKTTILQGLCVFKILNKNNTSRSPSGGE